MTQVRAQSANTDPQEGQTTPPYSMQLMWDPDDALFVVTVPELLGCMTHGATRAEAIARGENAIAMWLEGARHWGTPIPEPIIENHRDDAAPQAMLSHAEEEMFRYAGQLLMIRPDTENIPEWVREDLLEWGERVKQMTADELFYFIFVEGLPVRTRKWLFDGILRSMTARRELTGEEPPPIPWLQDERRSG